MNLPPGIHPVRWVLTGGTFQNSLLQAVDASHWRWVPLAKGE